jgi:hypothetical protein
MLDENGTIIYVGKAKNLHKRVSSYFNRPHTGKTARLVQDIKDFTYIVATSEVEAFLIEINLIKKYDPKYNIMLRDDKSYPYIEYIKKPYPRLKISRYLNIKKKDNKLLFGPYPNAYAARRIVNLLNRLYPLKKCEGNPKEVCLYYHIGECLGYCSKVLDNNKVEQMEHDILDFLRGNDKILKDKIKEKMQIQSDNMNYEVIVVGGGHAGCEAALASSRKGHKTLLVTGNINNIATMPCNPSIGGSAKGIIVREIDALGGSMGEVADATLIQMKMLNYAKGPAVKSLRAQADKITYPREMLKVLRDDFKGQVQLSIGMTSKDEVEEIVKFFEVTNQAKSRLLIYSCTSGYPVPAKDVALLEINWLYEKYGNEIIKKGIFALITLEENIDKRYPYYIEEIEELEDINVNLDDYKRDFLERVKAYRDKSSLNMDLLIAKGISLYDEISEIDLILNTIGISTKELTFWEKILFLVRLIPLCEDSYNLMELGGNGIGKTKTYSMFSPECEIVQEMLTTELIYNLKDKVKGALDLKEVIVFDEVNKIKLEGDKEKIDGSRKREPPIGCYS